MKRQTFKALILIFIFALGLWLFHIIKAQASSPLAVNMMSMSPCGESCAPQDPQGIPSDDDLSASGSSSLNSLVAPTPMCWKSDPKSKIAPISWYWSLYHTVHLQVYDSTGAWWFNGWVKSNSYTVFSKDGLGQYPGIPADGRTAMARISYDGTKYSKIATINCSLRK